MSICLAFSANPPNIDTPDLKRIVVARPLAFLHRTDGCFAGTSTVRASNRIGRDLGQNRGLKVSVGTQH